MPEREHDLVHELGRADGPAQQAGADARRGREEQVAVVSGEAGAIEAARQRGEIEPAGPASSVIVVIWGKEAFGPAGFVGADGVEEVVPQALQVRVREGKGGADEAQDARPGEVLCGPVEGIGVCLRKSRADALVDKAGDVGVVGAAEFDGAAEPGAGRDLLFGGTDFRGLDAQDLRTAGDGDGGAGAEVDLDADRGRVGDVLLGGDLWGIVRC